jgi:glycosyltransferase involved in cell wall biosynthesis
MRRPPEGWQAQVPCAVVLTVVMPAHNEQDYLEAAVATVVEGLRRQGEPFAVVVVENGSTDQTAVVARDLSARHPEVRAVSLGSADYGAALRAGLLEADGEWVVNFDVDFVDLSFLQRALEEAARTGAAIVVGSKRSPGADDRRTPGRRLVTAVFSVLLRVGFGLGVSDTHGLKLLRRPAMAPLAEVSRFGGDIFDTELILRAERAGLVVAEIPVRVSDQRPPRTPIVRRIPRSLLGLAKLRVSLWRSPFS